MKLDDIDPPEKDLSFGWGVLILVLLGAIIVAIAATGCASKAPPRATATVALSGRLQQAAQRADEAQNSSRALEGHITKATGTASRVDGKANVILEWLSRHPAP